MRINQKICQFFSRISFGSAILPEAQGQNNNNYQTLVGGQANDGGKDEYYDDLPLDDLESI